VAINWSLYKNFSESEYECRCGCKSLKKGKAIINDELLARIQELRDRCGFALPINSGLRCVQHNINSGGHKSSAHCDEGQGCMAVDLGVDREKGRIVLQIALEMGCFEGIGVAQRGKSGRFLHLDIKKRAFDPTSGKTSKAFWSYA